MVAIFVEGSMNATMNIRLFWEIYLPPQEAGLIMIVSQCDSN